MFYFLATVDGIANRTMQRIYETISPIEKIFSLKDIDLQKKVGLNIEQIKKIREAGSKISYIMNEYEKLSERDIEFTCVFDENYPEKLLKIKNRPMCLYSRGSFKDINKKSVAIVGARDMTNYGKEMTSYLVSNLAKENINIISGMAIGIDSVAHREAIKSNVNTYAVLGNGVNICYPTYNMDIYEHIKNSKRGAIISEFPLGKKPLAYNFPLRNRIISGLADIIVIVEARIKSGSLITASMAAEQGKEVFAVPGRLSDPLSIGCNRLIMDGAGIVTCVDDLLESLSLKCDNELKFIDKNNIKLANKEKIVYSCLDLSPKYLEDIVNETNIDYSEIISIILDLELRGMIKQVSGNYYVKSFK